MADQDTATTTVQTADTQGADTAATQTQQTTQGTQVATTAATATTATQQAQATEAEPWYKDEWRDRLANGDEKKLRVLKRYKDLNAWSEAGFNLRFARESGDLTPKLADQPTDDEVASYRKDNGIPADPNGYWGSMRFDNGLVIGDDDKPMVNEFMQMAHKENWTPKQVKTAVAAHYQFQEKAQAARADQDRQEAQEAEDALRSNMSPQDYRAAKASLSRFVGRFPQTMQPLLTNARLGNGQALFNNVEFLNWAMNLEREMNPAHTVVPNSANPMASIEDEIAQIETLMRTDRAAYFKDEAKQARYKQLLTAREAQKARAA